ncbi:MAG: glucosamine-6-phosphate deaminase [Phycisphaerales bacterium]|nr:glucosamine-6-phosphate deaminase [Phycisphaerales bacterium]
MNIHVVDSKTALGNAAAEIGANHLRKALNERGQANLIVATGSSQFEMLQALVRAPDIEWNQVTAFHLDEYAGMPVTHPASFRGYLWKRFASQLPIPLAAFHYINAEKNAVAECERLGMLIRNHPIDVAMIGIGENAHIAFNDPPANFETEQPYLVVQLDEACRRQQLGEGWFPTLADVPTQAISMSVRQIMKSRALVITVPDERKAQAVRDSVEGPITPMVPASILRQHPQADLMLDSPAASLLADVKQPV